MVDVDRRLNLGQHAHLAGLRRLSARASNRHFKPTANSRKGCFSFRPLAQVAIDRLHKGKVETTRGLTDGEICRIEATFAFTFPPDLKAILQEGLPVGPGFPDWRSCSTKHLRLLLNLPITGIIYEVARDRFWLKQWGAKPCSADAAVAIARSALKKAPILIPVYKHCYIPSAPNLAGNPIFFIRQQEVFCCGFDLADFFEKQDFVQPDYAFPFDFAYLDTPLNNNSLSHKCLRVQSDQASRKAGETVGENLSPVSSEGVEDPYLTDGSDWSVSGSFVDLECWGRNLDVMAKRGYEVASSRGSFESCSSMTKISRKHYKSDDLSNRQPVNGRMSSPTSSVVSRRIEFWSDLAKKRNRSSFSSDSTDAGELDDCNLSRKMNETLGTVEDGKDLFSCHAVDSNVFQPKHSTPCWLDRYFDKMATILRDGGWRETDISDVFDSSSFSSTRKPSMPANSQSMAQGLMLYVDLLSEALRKAGWRTTDVSDAFDVDFTFYEQQRRTFAVPPRVATKIVRLAEYVAQTC
ncbi:hypothetical protein KP509_17G057400 [Ceratopteris richardii]|uniref:Uncharacterized protein n=1 Tax=Ceratopteris richardii TaxID=49495 RepID=A0A8T2SUE1_CERRI|nr:hypothetical protein KP509_17G057400 [Ceratopteris richardii]